MLKWVLIVVGVVIVLVGLLAVIGLFMSKKHIASRRVKFSRTPEEVWNIVAGFEEFPSWRSDVKSVRREPDRNAHQVWTEVRGQGDMTYEVIAFDPPSKMIARIVGDNLPFGGQWVYEISPEENGCSLKITEEGEIYNPIFRTIARLFLGYHATMDSYLKDLGTKLGERVTFETT